MSQEATGVHITEDRLSQLLAPVEEVTTERPANHADAAVLIPIYGLNSATGNLKIILTKRPQHLKRHAGEISFPGGIPEDGESDLWTTALREAEEEIGLEPEDVTLVGSLPPISTFVTSYLVHPYVGILRQEPKMKANPAEVEAILQFSVDQLVASHEKRRLIRRGIPLKSDTYEIKGELIWGATARILTELISRLSGSPQG